VGLLAAVAWLAWPLPAAVLASSGAGSITLLDRSGQPLRSALGGEADRRWVAIADVDPDVLRAFIAVEDDRFFRHPGVDLHAVARAARDNWRAGRTVSGASTISMQLARLLVPLPRTWAGKLRQAAWALRLERHLAKQAILEQYLNRVPLGQGTVGIGAAADLYFDTGADALSVGQAALLAALARAPSRDNPLIAPDRARVRRAIALGRDSARGHATLGWAYCKLGRVDEGLAALERAVTLSPGDSLWLAQLGQACGLAGKADRAREILGTLEAQARTAYVAPYHLAYVYTGLGQFDDAMEQLEQAFERHAGAMYGVRGSFLFAPLRPHPRFQALLRRMHLV